MTTKTATLKKATAPKKSSNAKAVKPLAAQKSASAEVKIPKKRGPHGPRAPKVPSEATRIHVGQLISKRMKMRGLSKNKLAKTLTLTPPTISLMVNSNSVQTERLLEVSVALGYNFFNEIGQMLSLGSSTANLTEELDELHAIGLNKTGDKEYELRFLREENDYLKKIVELMAGGKN